MSVFPGMHYRGADSTEVESTMNAGVEAMFSLPKGFGLGFGILLKLPKVDNPRLHPRSTSTSPHCLDAVDLRKLSKDPTSVQVYGTFNAWRSSSRTNR